MSEFIVHFKEENGAQYEDMLRQQFYGQIDGRLRAVHLELDDYTYREFDKHITITCLNRTKEQNRTVGGKPLSSHRFGRGEDGRSRDFDDEELAKIERHLEEVWGDFLYVKVHGIGKNRHLHMNINVRYERKNFGQLKLR